MEIIEHNEYREDLLKWCNNVHLYWETMKPRFSKLFDSKSLDDLEESCRNLMGKLQTELEVTIEDYDNATSIYKQLDLWVKESNGHQEYVASSERQFVTESFDSDTLIAEPVKENDRIYEHNNERMEPIKMTLNVEIPTQELRKFLLDYKG